MATYRIHLADGEKSLKTDLKAAMPRLSAVNTLAPYLLTTLITMPKRLVYFPPACNAAPDRIWTTCYRRSGDGTLAGIRRNQVSGCTAGICRGATVSLNEVERSRTGMGAYEDGRRWRPGQYRQAHRTQVWLRPPTIRRRPFPEGISFTKGSVILTPPRKISSGRNNCSTCAEIFLGSS